MEYTRLSKNKRIRIIHSFIEDLPASTAARLIGINRKTVNTWYRELRLLLKLDESLLPPIRDVRVFGGYHARRITAKNGLFSSVRDLHRLESRFRFQLGKSKFKKLLLSRVGVLAD